METVVNPVAYWLALPDRYRKLHPIFHVSLLKLHHGEKPAFQEPISVEDSADAEEFEVEDILQHRRMGSTHRGYWEFLVKWRFFPVYDSTWEPESNLANAPDLLAAYKRKH